MGYLTSEDRIERFRDFILGASTPSPAVRNLTNGSNILLGVDLHGLARRANGPRGPSSRHLTELEMMGVSVFEALVGDDHEELAAYGKLVMEAKSRYTSKGAHLPNANVPDSIMQLENDEPLRESHFKVEAKAAVQNTLAQPHIRVVTLHDIQSDGVVAETHIFKAACSNLKRGVTFFSGGTNKVEELVRIKATPNVLRYAKGPGNSLERGTYCLWGFGAGQNTQTAHALPIPSLTAGKGILMPTDRPLYSGPVNSGLVGHLMCWESDEEGSSQWSEKLAQALYAIMGQINESFRGPRNPMEAEEDWSGLAGVIPPLLFTNPRDAAMTFWLENIGALVATVLDIFKAPGDRVMANSYALSTDVAGELSRKRQLELRLNGGDDGLYVIMADFGPDD